MKGTTTSQGLTLVLLVKKQRKQAGYKTREA